MYRWQRCISTWIAIAQIFHLLFPKPNKHPKTTKLNPNTFWMKQSYKKTINIDYYYFLPSMNHFRFMEIQYIFNFIIQFVLLDFRCQFLTSHAIFNNVHMQNGWIESSFVNFHPSPSVMLHFEAHFPHPMH